jgi:uncharacterized OB-fold protein
MITDIAALEATFLRLIADRDFRLPRWADTGAPVALGTRAPSDTGERRIAWREASGRGTVHSFCVFHRGYHPDFPVPYAVAVIELEEGHQIVSVVPGADLRVGLPVVAAFEPSGRLIFRPAPAGEPT